MKKIILVCLYFLLIFAPLTPEAKVPTEIIPQYEPPSVMEKAFLRSLDRTILEVMRNHGDHQLFEHGRIEKIVGDNQYDITLRVIGFEGAHNPPHKLIRMTIRIPGDGEENYTVVNYSHRLISSEEYMELAKFATDD